MPGNCSGLETTSRSQPTSSSLKGTVRDREDRPQAAGSFEGQDDHRRRIQSNAAAVLGKFTNDARIKVRRWAKLYDRDNLRAVTVVAGRIFTPDPKAARERASFKL
jgi:hypothetical protein